MRRDPFSKELLHLAQAEPSASQAFAVKALETWALLPAAQAEIDARHDDRLSFHLTLISSALSLPGTDDDHAGR
jgi:hypothetical protein